MAWRVVGDRLDWTHGLAGWVPAVTGVAVARQEVEEALLASCLLASCLLSYGPEVAEYATCIPRAGVGLGYSRRTVEVEHVEGEDADLHLEVVHVGILALARREHLQGRDG